METLNKMVSHWESKNHMTLIKIRETLAQTGLFLFIWFVRVLSFFLYISYVGTMTIVRVAYALFFSDFNIPREKEEAYMKYFRPNSLL